MARENTFHPRPNRQLSKIQLEIAGHWKGTVKATAKALFLEKRIVENALRSSKLRKLIFGEASVVESARAKNIARLERIAANRDGSSTVAQVLAAATELELIYARRERQERSDRAKAAKKSTGVDTSKPGTDRPQIELDLAERRKQLKASIAKDGEEKTKRDFPWLFDDAPAPTPAPAPAPTITPAPYQPKKWAADGTTFDRPELDGSGAVSVDPVTRNAIPKSKEEVEAETARLNAMDIPATSRPWLPTHGPASQPNSSFSHRR